MYCAELLFVCMSQTMRHLQVVKCEEDDNFLVELEKTMTTELAGRKMDNTRVNSSDLALPMNRGFKGFPHVGLNEIYFCKLNIFIHIIKKIIIFKSYTTRCIVFITI